MSSLLIIAVCFSVFIVKLVEVIRQQTISFDSENLYKVVPLMTNLSTYQQD